VNIRANDLVVVLLGVLGSIGPAALGVSVHRFLTWDLVQILMATDDDLRALAEDRGLDERTIQRADAVWWRQAAGRRGRARVVARGPNHEGPPPSVVVEES
jgi:hypothetical protein